MTRNALILIAIGVALGLLLARFVLPNLGPLSGQDTSGITGKVSYT